MAQVYARRGSRYGAGSAGASGGWFTPMGGYMGGGSTGSGVQEGLQIGNLVSELSNAIAQRKKTEAANQLVNQYMNTQDAPRAGLVSPGVSPTGQPNVIPAGVSTAGTAPFTGGVQGYEIQKQITSDDLAQQLQKAKIADYLAQVSGTGRYAKTTELTPYQQYEQQQALIKQQREQQQQEQKQQDALTKSVQSWQEKNAQTPETLAKEVDSKYGKGATEDLFNSWSTGSMGRGDPNPNYRSDQPLSASNSPYVYNPNGQFYYTNPTTDAQGRPVPGTALKTYEFEDLLKRKSAIDAAGGRLLPTPRATLVNPSANAGAVQPAKPGVSVGGAIPTPTSQAEFDAIPSGSTFIDGDGLTKVKP